MPFEFGYYTEFSDPVTKADPVVAAVAKAIELNQWTGKVYESMGAPSAPITSKEYEVFTRSKTARVGAVGTGGWGASATTALPVSADFAKGITLGTVLEVGEEAVIVKSVDRSANTIAVFRRGDGGTAATHAESDPIRVIGFAGSDTDLKDVEGYHEKTAAYRNYVQSVFEIIDWTLHGEYMRKGMTDYQAKATLIREAEIRVAGNLSMMAVNGYKVDAQNGATRYMSAGLLRQLADTAGGTREVLTYNVNGNLTEAKLLAAIRQCFLAGGAPDTIWCSPTVKTYINAFNSANSSLAINANKDDHGAGGLYVDHLDFEGNILSVRVDSAIPDGKVAVVKQEDLKKGWLEGDGLRLVDEPSPSSRETRKSLQGSVGFIVENVGLNHILLTGITGGTTERVYTTKSAS